MWKQHYDDHLNGAEVEYQDSRRNGFIGMVNEGDGPTPAKSEVKDAIKQLNALTNS